MNELKLELKKLIIKSANLDDLEPEEIKDDQPLFVEGLGLDSIDALEMAVALEMAYGVRITDSDTARDAFANIDALFNFVTRNRTK